MTDREDEKKKPAWRDINWLWVALASTALYLWITAWVVGWENICIFFTTTGSKLNEIGDFLAGVFAPVAVIWLVCAVTMQRIELKDARDQFAKNQELIDEQLKMVRTQNTQSAEQHKLAVGNAAKAYRLSLFDKRFAIYEKFVNLGHSYKERDYEDQSISAMIHLSHEASFVFDRSIADWFLEIAGEMEGFMDFKREHQEIVYDDGDIEHLPDDVLDQEIRFEKQRLRNRVRKNFIAPIMTDKFLRYMHVSDQSIVEG